ncbi:MAG: hypothetical protein RL410_817 [Actinomycetota bacterium]|jgi:prevent-host-death family protein
MERISHRELRNSSGEILRRVQEGHMFEITNNGVPVAQLVPVYRNSRQLNIAIPAKSDAPLETIKRATLPEGVSAVAQLIAERDAERDK